MLSQTARKAARSMAKKTQFEGMSDAQLAQFTHPKLPITTHFPLASKWRQQADIYFHYFS